MIAETLKEAVALAEQMASVWIATADAHGKPHIAVAGKLELAGENSLALTEWFCPGTVANLQTNERVSLVVWDKDFDRGYQLLGQLENMEDTGVLDGYGPEVEKQPPLPQVQRRLLVRVENIIDFKIGPHSDAQTLPD